MKNKYNYSSLKNDLVPRFVIEYANYTINTLCEYENEYTRDYVKQADFIIYNAIKYRSRGLVTIDETIRAINTVLNTILERQADNEK